MGGAAQQAAGSFPVAHPQPAAAARAGHGGDRGDGAVGHRPRRRRLRRTRHDRHPAGHHRDQHRDLSGGVPDDDEPRADLPGRAARRPRRRGGLAVPAVVRRGLRRADDQLGERHQHRVRAGSRSAGVPLPGLGHLGVVCGAQRRAGRPAVSPGAAHAVHRRGDADPGGPPYLHPEGESGARQGFSTRGGDVRGRLGRPVTPPGGSRSSCGRSRRGSRRPRPTAAG
ncbi:hypothetical protein BCL50_3556 [Mycolicibacterium litorale]|nr:hypothetical protein BCL50_3556 [Mycolicibacterium litorale]